MSMGAFDPQLYRILLAEEINFMFNENRTFPLRSAKTTLLVSAGILQQCTMDLTRSLHTDKTDSKLTAIPAWCCCWKFLMVISSTGCCSTSYQSNREGRSLNRACQHGAGTLYARKCDIFLMLLSANKVILSKNRCLLFGFTYRDLV